MFSEHSKMTTPLDPPPLFSPVYTTLSIHHDLPVVRALQLLQCLVGKTVSTLMPQT